MSVVSNDNNGQPLPTLCTKMVAVQKRSGETVPFDAFKIYYAIKKAVAVTDEIDDAAVIRVTQSALDKIDERFAGKTPKVEEIQDAVVEALMDAHAYKTAQSYIIYRQKRSEIRDASIDAVEVIEGYVGGSNWRIKENANIGYSIGGLILRTSERVTDRKSVV